MACHTLPYSCALVQGDDRQPHVHLDETYADEDVTPAQRVTPPPIEIRQGDLLVHPRALHSPVTETVGPTRGSTFARTHVIPIPEEDSPTPPKLNPSLPPTPPFPSPPDHPKSKPRWILTPRRGHAALNAGIRSLGDRDVTLVAYPGELLDEMGDVLDEADLSMDLKQDLDRGLSALGKGRGRPHGVKCIPVWLDDKLATNFYEGYCKGYLWPIFHYFVSARACPRRVVSIDLRTFRPYRIMLTRLPSCDPGTPITRPIHVMLRPWPKFINLGIWFVTQTLRKPTRLNQFTGMDSRLSPHARSHPFTTTLPQCLDRLLFAFTLSFQRIFPLPTSYVMNTFPMPVVCSHRHFRS